MLIGTLPCCAVSPHYNAAVCDSHPLLHITTNPLPFDMSRLGSSIINNQRSTYSELGKSQLVVTAQSHFPQYRLYSHYVFSRRGYTPFTGYGTRLISRREFSKKFSTSSVGNFATHNAQVVWRRLYDTCFCNGKTFPLSGSIGQAVGLAIRTRNHIFKCGILKTFSNALPSTVTRHRAQVAWRRLYRICNGKTFSPIGRIAQAVSLALDRCHFVVPGIFTFTLGKQALAQRSLDYTDEHPSRNSLYMRAQDGHTYVSSLLFSAYEGVVLFMRALYLAILFAPCIIMAPFVDYFGPQYRNLWLQVVHGTLGRAGPAFIKWGQWAATRPDLFARDLCTKLAELHTKAPEHSFAYSKKTIEEAFGHSLSEIFEDFEESPVASGSIAQVHRASLKIQFPGQKLKPAVVAVKVRHPGVGESIRRDFVIMNFVAKISNFIPTVRWLRLDESVQQFAVFMMSQVDLAREAAHLSRFIYNFRWWKDVSFPKPVYPLVHAAVLVETYEQGECVSHYVDDDEGQNRIKSALAHIGTHALLKMLLVDNFIHADMHPGNILVRVSQNKSSRKRLFKSKPHVVFLDVGMIAELSENDRVNLVEFFQAVAQRDGRTAAECTLRLSKKQNCPNPKAFIEEVEESFSFWGTPEGDKVHPAECMQQLLEKVRRHKVNIDGNVCTVMVTTLVLEGWQRKLDPGYNVMRTLQRLLLKADWAKSLTYTIEGLMAP